MELRYIFYVTVNVLNGKFYFGVHRTNPEVFDGYIGCGIYRLALAILDIAFHKAVKKHGYNNFKRTTIAVFPDTEEGRQQAFELEASIVTPILLRSKTCYNTVVGGKGEGSSVQDKTVYLFSLDGNFLRSYKTAREAALNIDPLNLDNIRAAIKNCCLGKSNSSYGYYWSYIKEFVSKVDLDIKRRKDKIALYTLSGKFLRYFDNITEARNETGLHNIYYAIKNNASVGGFLWKYFTGNTSNINPFESTVNRTKPIVMIKNDIETEYESIKKCIEINPELSSKGIKNVLRGINKTHKGCKFRWKDDDIV